MEILFDPFDLLNNLLIDGELLKENKNNKIAIS